MSLPMPVTVKCAICRKESTQTVMASSNTFGGTPDLDLRPAEMMRSTMSWWIQECPHCGYISRSLDDKTSVTREWLRQEAFATTGGRKFLSNLAAQFYKYYLINVADNNEKAAFYAALHAAWACDDECETENAIHCRQCALAELEKILANPNTPEDMHVVKTDLLRRTGQFDALISDYAGKQFSKNLLNQIVAFQIEKARQNDTQCYRIQDVPWLEDE